ncbi:MAG: hypothetical protein KGI54_14240 [Pseudomonadota bacterium]|nr:hypothetical protein [Pseudomonadota bacterium]
MTQKDSIVKSPSGRVKRTPVGTRNILTVRGKDPDYVYRIVNDVGDRVEVFKEAGYEPVLAEQHLVGDRRVNKPSDEGSIATAHVGGGQKAVVMRIRKEYFEEDQAAKQAQIDELEGSQRPENLNGYYGKSEFKVKSSAD